LQDTTFFVGKKQLPQEFLIMMVGVLLVMVLPAPKVGGFSMRRINWTQLR
jgi:hypothetical protein